MCVAYSIKNLPNVCICVIDNYVTEEMFTTLNMLDWLLLLHINVCSDYVCMLRTL